MIKYIKKFIKIYKKSLYHNKINNLFINSSITTSCNIPGYVIHKKIWVLHLYDDHTNIREYHWIENEEEAKQIEQVLNNFNYNFLIKEYEVN